MTRKRCFVAVITVMTGLCALSCSRVSPVATALKFPDSAQLWLSSFEGDRQPDLSGYDYLFRYFLEGFETYRSNLGALAFYRGLPSRHGSRADALEGFSRSAPMWGAWVRSGRPRSIQLANGKSVDLVEEFRRGLLAGTNPNGEEYWGNVSDLDQRIVEASDVALSLWLFRDTVWDKLSSEQKARVASWLTQSEAHKVSDNNWHLFPVFIGAVLTALDIPSDESSVSMNYSRFKSFYRGDGWFSDGPDNTYDYYNAWSIQYQLYWLQQVNPEWDRSFITMARQQFLATYPYLIGPQGLPILGRSVCYRMAAPVPLIIGQQTDPDEVSPAEARRALDSVWSYFIKRGALRDGNVSQGYCGGDPRIVDNYSGPASCLWALRSLIAAYYQPADSSFWRARGGQLPVEQHSYRVQIPAIHWAIVGDKASLNIQVEKPGDPVGAATHLSGYGPMRQLASAFLWRPFRPDNTQAKYDRNSYSSAQPFCGCTGVSEKDK